MIKKKHLQNDICLKYQLEFKLFRKGNGTSKGLLKKIVNCIIIVSIFGFSCHVWFFGCSNFRNGNKDIIPNLNNYLVGLGISLLDHLLQQSTGSLSSYRTLVLGISIRCVM